MWKQIIELWKEAIKFHIKNFNHVLPIIPFLFIPIVGNLLHSIIFRQYIYDDKIEAVKGLKFIKPLLWPYLKIKLRFTAIETISNPIPIVDEIVDVNYTQYASMISNVIVFEGLVGKECIYRCKEVIFKSKGLAIKATFLGPLILFFGSFALWTIIVSTIQPPFSLIFLILVVVYIFGPLSSATNTLMYLFLVNEKTY